MAGGLCAAGLDPAAVSKEMLSLLEAAELKVGKAKMEAAKAGAAAFRRNGTVVALTDVSVVGPSASRKAYLPGFARPSSA